MPDFNKYKIGHAFDRAAHCYDDIADFQHKIGKRLAQYFSAFLSTGSIIKAPYILDGGCGTGYNANLIREFSTDSYIVGCDLSLQMLLQARARQLATVSGDLECLPFRDAAFHYAWSSLALQWCRPQIVFPELRRVLRPGGKLLFTTLLEGSLHELEDVFSNIDKHRHVLPFRKIESILAALRAAGFSKLQYSVEHWRTHHADFNSLLASIRGIGARQIGSQQRRGMMGKTAWQTVQTVQTRYETLRTAGGLPVSYVLLFVCAEK